jgi:hypothetical protein
MANHPMGGNWPRVGSWAVVLRQSGMQVDAAAAERGSRCPQLHHESLFSSVGAFNYDIRAVFMPPQASQNKKKLPGTQLYSTSTNTNDVTGNFHLGPLQMIDNMTRVDKCWRMNDISIDLMFEVIC